MDLSDHDFLVRLKGGCIHDAGVAQSGAGAGPANESLFPRGFGMFQLPANWDIT